MRNHAGFSLAALLTAVSLSGTADLPADPSGDEHRAAARAVTVVTGAAVEPAELTAAVPADFDAVMGYEPRLATDPDGTAHLVDPGGGCSWLGDTAYGFDRACRSHDLGYDLLRYAAAQGGELGPGARHALDDRLAADLRARCANVDGGAPCRALARAAEGGVAFNSWRQGHGAPTAEPVVPIVLGALAAAALCLAPRARASVHTTARVAAYAACRAVLPANDRPPGPVSPPLSRR